MDQETRDWLMDDELPRVRPCLDAAVTNAEERGLSYYAILSPRYYSIIRNGIIESTVERAWGTNLRIYLRKWFARFKVLEPRDEYRCL